MRATQAAIYAVTVKQNGSGGVFLMDKTDMDALYAAVLQHGAVVAIWLASEGVSSGVIVNPTMGGMSLHMAPAGPVAVDAEGNACAPENAAGHLSPDRFPLARVVTPAWFLRALADDGGGRAGATIEPPAPEPPAEPMPSPVPVSAPAAANGAPAPGARGRGATA